MFHGNNSAINRLVTTVSVTNNIFAENTFTITSDAFTQIDPNINVSYNCFYRNDDLEVSTGVDSALGSDFQIGDPLFVDVTNSDFHLQEDSICIDTGTGTDVIDDTTADIGAYGGDYADATPFPVAEPAATDSSTSAPDVFNITLDWQANLAYLVTNTVTPGSYKVWYQRNQPGPPYNGTDAGNGTIGGTATQEETCANAAPSSENDWLVYELASCSGNSPRHSCRGNLALNGLLIQSIPMPQRRVGRDAQAT